MWRSSMTRISRRVVRSPAILGNATLAAQIGTTVSALVGGAVVTLSYGHLLWANAMLSRIPVLLVLRASEAPATLDRGKRRVEELKEMLSTTLIRDTATRLVFLRPSSPTWPAPAPPRRLAPPHPRRRTHVARAHFRLDAAPESRCRTPLPAP